MFYVSEKYRQYTEGVVDREGSGEQVKYRFPNGFSASVIRCEYSYGGSEGLYELAVMDGDKIRYDTPITTDVLGWLDDAGVDKALDDIFALSLEKVELDNAKEALDEAESDFKEARRKFDEASDRYTAALVEVKEASND